MDPERPALELRVNTTDDQAIAIDESNWDYEVRERKDGTDVLFRFDDGTGNLYEKEFGFHEGRYHVDFTMRIRTNTSSGGRGYLLSGANNLPGKAVVQMQIDPSAVVGREGERKLTTYQGSQLVEETRKVEVGDEPIAFFGSHNVHFAAVVAPLDQPSHDIIKRVFCQAVFDEPAFRAEVARRESELGMGLSSGELNELRSEFVDNAMAVATLAIPNAADTQQFHFQYYLGPKDPHLLDAPEYASLRSLYEHDYGSMFPWINKLLLVILRMFHSLTGNWGVAIILLTVLVKTLLFPMNRLQSKQMEQFQKKMAKLKPQLEELKKKFKNNSQKFAEAQRKLMQEHQVKPPVFGCLVLFLQFPVFIGLFQILRTSFELRQAHFVGWIDDLSLPDAMFQTGLPFISDFNLLPILMVAAMVLQAKMMPKPADPQAAQMQKMMMFMPFMFCFFLYNYSSGLSLYMLTNALLGIIQSKYLRTHTAT
jgi:YidC/Oxa1 family membrane protein insertase